jgi:hypothetical protein
MTSSPQDENPHPEIREIVRTSVNPGGAGPHGGLRLNNIIFLLYTKMNDLNNQLFAAASANNAEDILNLIKNGADVNAEDAYGWTPIIYSIYNRNIESIELLIKNGAKIDVVTNDNNNLLKFAIRSRQIKIFELILDDKSDINFRDLNGWTPLHMAVDIGAIEIVKLLLIRGADYTIINNDKETPLDVAVKRKNYSKFNVNAYIQIIDIIEDFINKPDVKFAGRAPMRARTPDGTLYGSAPPKG